MYLWRKSATARWLAVNEAVLQAKAGDRLALIERPGRKRSQVEVSCDSARQARRLTSAFGGSAHKLPDNWLEQLGRRQKNKPLCIGKRLVVLRSPEEREANSERIRERAGLPSSLIIPAGAAFGTGDHATTAMSLRLLEEISRGLKPGWSVVDLGTGSGILALAAKRFGAGRVLGLDNDKRAIATAKENARTNGIDGVVFRVADVRRWPSTARIEIVTANLFSDLLIEILPKLQRAHWLILSGILRTQEEEVGRALRQHKIEVMAARRRGKWVALAAQKPI